MEIVLTGLCDNAVDVHGPEDVDGDTGDHIETSHT